MGTKKALLPKSYDVNLKIKEEDYLMRIILFCGFLLLNVTVAFTQDLGQIGKAKLFKLTGGVAANAVYYEGMSNRDPFTYILSGNINLNISNVYNIPFSFSYSNQKFASSNPFSFNRLSMHPSYKWVTTHIGDVSMNFSPYTLSGHQFTGFGFDLTPGGKWNISAMYGRLLKQSEYNEDDPNSQPAFKRMGYGLKAGYAFEKFSLGAIFFKASDDQNSIQNQVPLTFELQPKDNVVVSLEGNIKLLDKGQIRAEAALSTITEDINATGEETNPGIFSSLLKTNITTNQYKAYNLGFSYAVGQGTVGVNYEYIDPEYRTLGAYFFNNDLENITINATQNVFDNKVSIVFNGGLQRDDLDNVKSTQLQRVVGSINVTYNASEKLNLSGGYSNFQSFTNIKDQFDFINEVSQTENLDTLDFQQISQNANLNVNYILKDTDRKKQNLGMTLSYQNAVNKQGGNTLENGKSNFYNGNVSYSIGYPANDLNVSTSVNVSYSAVGVESATTYGPILSVNKKFFDKQLRTNGSVSYNQSQVNGTKQGEVTNIRLGSSYSYKKKHNFSLNLLSQFKNGTTSNQNFTATFGYSYILDKFKPKINFPKRKPKARSSKKKNKNRKDSKETVSFRYRDSLYAGTLPEVNIQLQKIQNHPRFDYMPTYKKGELAMLRQIAEDEKHAKEYKPKALEFLKELYSYEDFLAGYERLIYETMMELKRDMNRLDYAFEMDFVKSKVKVDQHKLHSMTSDNRTNTSEKLQKEYQEAVKNNETALARLIGHRWMLIYVMKYNTLEDIRKPDRYLKEVMEVEKENIFKMWDRDEEQQRIQLYIITKIIDFYFKESVHHTDPNKFELKYIEKK
ncbi:TonB-dependent receptor [Aquimarina sp. M1]